MDDNFKFSGFPSNEEINIPDTEQNLKEKFGDVQTGSTYIKKIVTNLDEESLKTFLPKELLDSIKKDGRELSDIIAEIKEAPASLIDEVVSEIMQNGFGAIPNNENSEAEYEENNDQIPHELIDTKYLEPTDFASILVKESENLYEEFIEKYGVDSSKYLDSAQGVKLSYLNETTSQLPFTSIKNLEFVESNNRFLLFYAKPESPEFYGFFVSFFKDINDEFVLYIPEFGNTFSVNGDTVTLYKPEERPDLFSFDGTTKEPEFQFLSLVLLETALFYISCPEKKVLLSPSQFGETKNIKSSSRHPSQFLRIGTIISNESQEAILLKKDAELDLNETKFPLYFKFNKIVDAEVLQQLTEIFFKADLNNSELFKNSELKYTNDHKLYIDVDFGDI